MKGEEILEKFKSILRNYMNNEQINQIIRFTFELYKLNYIGELNRLLVFRSQG